MKLDKENIQKIVLGAMLAAGLIYSYVNFLMAPLKTRASYIDEATGKVQAQLDAAKLALKRGKDLEAQARVSGEVFDRIKGLIPDGSPLAWFPSEMEGFCERQGVGKCVVRLANAGPLGPRELQDFRRLYWLLELPKVLYAPVGIAVASLENEKPLIEINSIDIEALADDPERQKITLSLASIVNHD